MLSFWFVLWCWARQPNLMFLGSQGPQQTKGHFKDYELGTNCMVLLIVLCLWKGRVFIQFLWPECLHSFGAMSEGGRTQDFLGVFATKIWCDVRVVGVPPCNAVSDPLHSLCWPMSAVA